MGTPGGVPVAAVTRAVDQWTVTAAGAAVPAAIASRGEIPATVPGCVHTDLMAAGAIADPYLDENEKLQSWIGLADWTYRGVVDWTPDGRDRQALVFGGIDTIARIRLNGRDLAATRNMHRSYRFDVTGSLVEGENLIEVAISSPIKAADSASLALGYRPHVNHHPYNAIRKMACSFGWDWGIDTATSALWKPVELESWSGPRFAEVRISGDLVDGVAVLRVAAAVEGWTDHRGLSVQIRVGEEAISAALSNGCATLELAAPGAELWWPRGFGEAILHDATVDLFDGDVLIERRSHRVGFRSVEIRTDPDGQGSGFSIEVNGRPVAVRGANWIPDDAFLHRVDRARYARRIAQAEFAGINLLRVWGGGIYESDDFYAECDERGILVWQDFLLACAAYAEEGPLWSEIEAEAREAVARLAAHPSLVVLNGNNENLWGYEDWGWSKRLGGRSWGAGYYYDLFPRLVAELASHVAYVPGSPFSPDPAAHPNDPDQGTQHIWDVWNARDWPDYRQWKPRFVAEFGWQGPPTWSTLTRAINDEPLTPESPGMLVHQKAARGNDKLTDGLTAHFDLPNTMDDWHWAMSLNQAIAVRSGVEWFRSLTPLCTGSIVWQLNDCWPVTSWSAVDGDERPKPLLYALRQAHADRLITVQPDGDALRVAVINDTDDAWVGELELERRTFGGELREQVVLGVSVPARGARNIPVPHTMAHPDDAAEELLVARLGETRALWFFAEYRDSRLPPAEMTIVARAEDGDWVVSVTAAVLVRDLTLLVDRLSPGAVADRALESILPGETLDFRITGARGIDPQRFSDRTVLRTANDLVSTAPTGAPAKRRTAC